MNLSPKELAGQNTLGLPRLLKAAEINTHPYAKDFVDTGDTGWA